VSRDDEPRQQTRAVRWKPFVSGRSPGRRSSTLNGRRYYVEYDKLPPVRAAAHRDRILANDPKGDVSLITQP
jgi:hypothetical protein